MGTVIERGRRSTVFGAYLLSRRLGIEAAGVLAARALIAAGTARETATTVAAALVAAELDGLATHGLSRVAAYSDQVAAGKVDGQAQPRVTRAEAAAMTIDARHGFAYPAIAAGLAPAIARAKTHGSCALAVAHSHHAGVLGHHVERIAEAGLVAFGFANAPGAIAPWGGKQRVFGTNPIAFAAPRHGAPPLVIDLSVSTVARGHVMLARQRDEAIPDDWALDVDGVPTTDAEAALAGTMRPLGGAKGAALALMVEIMAAVFTGSSLSADASSLFDANGAPPDLGHSFVLLDPGRAGGADFSDRLENLLHRIVSEPGVRLPGARRLNARADNMRDGIEIPPALYAELRERAGASA